MTNETFAEAFQRLQQDNLALRESLKQMLVFVRPLLSVSVENEEEESLLAEIRGHIERAEDRLNAARVPHTAPCTTCGRDIAVICDGCLDDVHREVQRRHLQKGAV